MKNRLGVKVLGITLLFGALGLIAGNGRSVAGGPPGKLSFLIGEWEAPIPGNPYRMRITWDEKNHVFKGFLSKSNALAKDIGFTLDEHVWTGQPVREPDILVEVQKWRFGANGVSDKVEWRVGKVDLESSSASELVTPTAKFKRVK